MKKIKVKLDYIIGNAAIEIYKREKRRVIDKKDIDNYEKIFTSNLHANGINPEIIANEDVYSDISEYFCSFDRKFVIFPWISIEELISKYQESISDSMLEYFSNEKFSTLLLNRTESELAEFDKVSCDISTLYINEENEKIDSLEKEKEKCLIKIENIRKNTIKK